MRVHKISKGAVINKHQPTLIYYPFIGGFLAITLLSGLAPTKAAVQETADTEVSVGIDPVIGLTLDTNSVTIPVAPLNSTALSTKHTAVNVYTNHPGYTLTMQANSGNTTFPAALVDITTPTTTSASRTIAASTNTTPATLATNTWGWATPTTTNGSTPIPGLPSGANGDPNLTGFQATYHDITNNKVTDTPDQGLNGTTASPEPTFMAPPVAAPLIIRHTGAASNSDTTNVYYGAKVDGTQAAGTYRTIVTYTVTGEPIPNPTPTTLQDLTQAYCSSMDTYTGSNTPALLNLEDSRDSRTYTVGKLVDGNCWMLDNLRLGNNGGTMLLTSNDTDLNITSNPNITNNSGTLQFTLPILAVGGSTSYDDPGVYGPVAGDGGFGSTNYGYLYNWPAATAGESRTTAPADIGNVQNSICPAGWRLPYSDGTWNGGNSGSDLARLNNAMYSGTTTSSNYYDSTHAANWNFTSPFRGVFSGNWDGGFNGQGSNGNLWTSSANPGYFATAFSLFFDSSLVGPDYSDYRYFGLSVRCLLR
ncbi:MAG: fibrobacter succinogenes major paralogous domain-containing protein [Candidatus Nomurabacteria bacterium]|nr:fibrobacter succinogenes major paralogous domain-containing protein [Candidatus Nomurabacteria bacterium]